MRAHRTVLALLFFWPLLALTAQIQTTTRKGLTTINTTNMEPMAVQSLDGVATHYDTNDAPGLSGSPYLDEEFAEGTLTVRDGTVVPGLRYRYNIFNDRMEIIVNKDTAVIDKPLAVKSVQIGDTRFVYDVYMAGADRVATSYFRVVEETDAMTVLQRLRIELEQDIYVPHYAGGGGTKEFMMVRKDSYYIRFGDGAAQEITRKRDFLKLFNVLRSQVKSYMKEHHLSVRKEADLKDIARFYNEMVFSNF